eukprot:scaffold31789_cov122-Amphora_coffeaeformis.AAC.1
MLCSLMQCTHHDDMYILTVKLKAANHRSTITYIHPNLGLPLVLHKVHAVTRVSSECEHIHYGTTHCVHAQIVTVHEQD